MRRAILVAVILSGVAALGLLAWVIVYDPQHRPWILNHHFPFPFTDLIQRYIESIRARGGFNVYLPLNPPQFTYPPAALVLFIPLTFLPLFDALLLWTVLSMLCLAATYLVVLRTTQTGTWLQHVAIATWASVVTLLVFPPIQAHFNMGQIGTILVLLITLDVLAIRDRSQGVLVGVAAAFKLYPGVVILFWLVRRQSRPAITASVTFGLITAVSWMTFPRDSSFFFSRMLFGGDELRIFETPGWIIRSSSLTGAFLRISALPQSLAVGLGLLSSCVVAILGVLIAARVYERGYRVSALTTLLCTSCLISAVAFDHYFTFAPLLVFVLMEVGLTSASGISAAAALALFLFPWFAFRLGFIHPSLTQDIVVGASRNAVFVAALLVVLSAALAASREVTKSVRAPERAEPLDQSLVVTGPTS
jgi:alpha-1,2-mannosyltransferase